MGLQARRLRGACAPRKVRTPQGRVLGNAQAGKPDGRAQQREDRRCGLRPQVRVKRCGKSAPAVPVTAPARQAPPGATPDRDDDAARRVPGRRQRAVRQRAAQMDSRPRQNPAYRPANGKPRPGGVFPCRAPLADDAVPEIPELEDRGADRGHPGRAAAGRLRRWEAWKPPPSTPLLSQPSCVPTASSAGSSSRPTTATTRPARAGTAPSTAAPRRSPTRATPTTSPPASAPPARSTWRSRSAPAGTRSRAAPSATAPCASTCGR